MEDGRDDHVSPGVAWSTQLTVAGRTEQVVTLLFCMIGFGAIWRFAAQKLRKAGFFRALNISSFRAL
jgi:hypothetical protein